MTNPPQEVWHFTKPVIGCNIPAVAEVIDHGINGYQVSQTPESIAEAILQLLLDLLTAVNDSDSYLPKQTKITPTTPKPWAKQDTKNYNKTTPGRSLPRKQKHYI